MDIAVEISLYPLRADFIPSIADFIDRLNAYEGVKVVTNSMSTQVSGDYTRIMQILTTEIRQTFESTDKAVFAMKVLGPFKPA